MSEISPYMRFFLLHAKELPDPIMAAMLLCFTVQPTTEIMRIRAKRNSDLYDIVVSSGIVLW